MQRHHARGLAAALILICWLVLDPVGPAGRDVIVEGQRRGLEAVAVDIAVAPVLSELLVVTVNGSWQLAEDSGVVRMQLISGDRVTFTAGERGNIVRVVDRSEAGSPDLGRELVVPAGDRVTIIVIRDSNW